MSLEITNEDNMELMARYPDNYFDLAIVDPPYRNAKDNDMGKNARKVISDGRLKDWQDKPGGLFFEELKRVSKNQIIWGANNFNLDFKGFVVWDKNIPEDFTMSQCEIASISENLGTISKMFKFRIAGSQKNKIHPTQKPIELYKWLIDKYAKPGDKILDTHLGSGSIAIACHDYGYDLTACELDKEYFDKAMLRIKQHTSQVSIFDVIEGKI